MRNIHAWKPGKFIPTKKGWIPSNDRQKLGVGSRFIASLQLPFYSKLIQEHAAGRLLDLGCGDAPYFGIYRDFVTENICIDRRVTPYLDFLCDLNGRVPIRDSEFDTILCTDVLEHLYSSMYAFAEMTRLLKPGGKLILCVPFTYYLHEEPHDFFRYTKHALIRFSEINHLDVLVLDSYGGALEIIADIIAKNISDHPLISAIHLRLSLALVRSYWGRTMSRRSGQRFPLGYCFVGRKCSV